MRGVSYRVSVVLQGVVVIIMILLQLFSAYVALRHYGFGWYSTSEGLVRGTPPMALPCIAAYLAGAFILEGVLLQSWLKQQPLHWLALSFTAMGLASVGVYGIWLVENVYVIVTK
jgi:hypothetical protein